MIAIWMQKINPRRLTSASHSFSCLLISRLTGKLQSNDFPGGIPYFLSDFALKFNPGVGISENFPGTRYPSVPKIFFLAGTRFPSVPKIFFLAGTWYPSVPKIFFLAGTRYPSVPKIFFLAGTRYPSVPKFSKFRWVPLAPTPGYKFQL